MRHLLAVKYKDEADMKRSENTIVHRPNVEAMDKLLEKHRFDAVGGAIRLAWWAGLLRNEIVELTWDRVSFLNNEIELMDRNVPMLSELETYLTQLSTRLNYQHQYVLLSDHRRKPMKPQPLSALVRKALDEVGQTEVTLKDLRCDFIIRQLEQHDWQYVSRITGNEAISLNQHFAPYISDGAVSTRICVEKKALEIDDLRLQKLLQEEGTSVVGLAIRLVWQGGLKVSEAAELTWERVDINTNSIHLPRGAVSLPLSLTELLRPLKEQADPMENVLLTPRSRRPMGIDRISRMVRAALIQAGLDNVTLVGLWAAHNHGGGEEAILDYVARNGSITRQKVVEQFGGTKSAAYENLTRLVQRGELVRLGHRYYLIGTVIAPKDQYAVIRDYLQEMGFAYRQDIARILNIDPRQCSFVLKTLLDEGKLTRDKQRYMLKDT